MACSALPCRRSRVGSFPNWCAMHRRRWILPRSILRVLESDEVETYTLHRGTAPLFVSLPHDGIALPDNIATRMTPTGQGVPDTDWHVSRMYAFARELGASMIVPKYSRYVVDLNRPPDDVSLYPGQNTTGLCPIVQFSGAPVYLPGREPTPGEIAQRVERYWRPYHDALAAEIARIKSAHGRAV